MSYGNKSYDGYVVRLRGLPWSVGQEEIANFLSGCNVQSVNFTYTRDGRPSGEAYVELSSDRDVENALAKNQQHMGKRYIEVFRSSQSEMEFVLSKDGPSSGGPGNGDGVVRLRGLPFSCSHEDISRFFSGMQIVANGIALLADQMGRASGEAYVQFASQAIADLALQKHKEKMGTRYVEIFKSSMLEAENAIAIQGRYDVPNMGGGGRGGARPSPYDRPNVRGGMSRGAGAVRGAARGGRGGIKPLTGGGGGYGDSNYGAYGSNGGGGGYNDSESYGYGGGYGTYGSRGGSGGGRGGGMRGGRGGGASAMSAMSAMPEYESSTGHSVHMRGLPYSATESDIYQFFAPLNPVQVVIQYNNDGRPSGEADVDFNSHREAEAAMKKHKALMDKRYIELFLTSEDYGGGYGGGSGYGGGNGYQQKRFTENSGYGGITF